MPFFLRANHEKHSQHLRKNKKDALAFVVCFYSTENLIIYFIYVLFKI